MTRGRVTLGLIRIVARLVPADEREDWLREWEAELVYHLRSTGPHDRDRRPTLAWQFARLFAAAQHAWWLRRTWRNQDNTHHAGLWTGLGEDLTGALRLLRRSPLFAASAIATLALGVGLVSAILSFADGYLFRPLPFPHADRAYYVHDPNARIASMLTAADVLALRESPVADFGWVQWSAAFAPYELHLTGRTIPVWPYEVTAGFRGTLTLPLVAGHDFVADDHQVDAPLVAWLSHRFWQREFGGDLAVLNQVVRATGTAGPVDVHIVGILGPGVATFDNNNRPPDVVVPERGRPQTGRNILARPIVLLPEHVTPEEATARIAGVLQAVAPAADGRPRTVRLSSFERIHLSGGAPTARVLFAGAMLVMLLAVMNLAHLLISRGEARAQDLATRVALGASRWRVLRACVVESAVLGVLGTAMGLAGGRLLSAVIAARVPELPTGGRNLAMVPVLFDTRVLIMSAALGLVAATAGGLWPAWRAWRGSMAARTRPSSRLAPRVARVLLASELTVVTVVAVGAAFVGVGIHRYLNQPLGFEYRDRVRVYVQLPSARVSLEEAVAAVRAVRGLGGIRAAGLESQPVPNSALSVPGVAIERPRWASGVPPGLFEAWGMQMAQGRWFDDREFAGADVAVVNAHFASLAWPLGDALGATIHTGDTPRRVIGVVQSHRWMLEREPTPEVFVPVPDRAGDLPLVLWAPGIATDAMRDRITAAVASAIPGARVTATALAFDTMFARGSGEARFQMPIVIAFGALGALLALVGIFGVVSFLVHQRAREFGIRLALGAQQRDVIRAVLIESLRPAAFGLAAGALAAWALDAVVKSTVFGWPSSGSRAILIVATGILVVAVLAALAPALRAARIDPATSLRAE
jgi:predicted permease